MLYKKGVLIIIYKLISERDIHKKLFYNKNFRPKYEDCDFMGQFGNCLFQILKAYAKTFTKMFSNLGGGWEKARHKSQRKNFKILLFNVKR